MEQSRLCSTAARFCRALYLAQKQARQRRFAAASTGCTANPSVFSEERDRELKPAAPYREPEETRNRYEPGTAKRQRDAETEYRASKETDPLAPPRLPHASFPKLEHTEVHNPVEPQIQQKREKSNSSSTPTVTVEEISCAGLDGTPWPEEEEKESKEDENEYYRHHKASPLSEIKVADTRKPITRATDGTADAGDEYGIARNVIGWLPEQLDTAEEALERARRMWRENAERGDPESPHGRVLRELRGEWF